MESSLTVESIVSYGVLPHGPVVFYCMGEKFEKLENLRLFFLTLFELWCFRAFVLEARRLPSKTWEKNARAHLRVCQ